MDCGYSNDMEEMSVKDILALAAEAIRTAGGEVKVQASHTSRFGSAYVRMPNGQTFTLRGEETY